MFQWNEQVEMNKFFCSLACTWMTIIDSQFYIIDSLSLDVSLEWNANLVVAWLYYASMLLYIFLTYFDYQSCFDCVVLCGCPKETPGTFIKAAKSVTFNPLHNVLLELMFLISKNTVI